MNKLLSMSFVFVFIGLVSLALYTSPAHSESPFETPPKGGLPACTEEVDICTEKVNRCNESLSTCTTDFGTCDIERNGFYQALQTANTSLSTCTGELVACRSNGPDPSDCPARLKLAAESCASTPARLRLRALAPRVRHILGPSFSVDTI